MARLSLGDKATRVLKMLMGMRNARVTAALAAHGLTDADLQEGWKVLQGVSREKLDGYSGFVDAGLVDRLDAWENRWFPIASATLERRFPAVHAQLFNRLSQTSGPAVAVSVGTFIARFDEMAAGGGSYGEEGAAAKGVLETRGLTPSVLDQARTMLETVGSIEAHASVTTVEENAAQLAKAEERLWGWYLEWSQIARIAVNQRVLLKQMGFMAAHAKADTVPDSETPPSPEAVDMLRPE
jgi:hypothetical protein